MFRRFSLKFIFVLTVFLFCTYGHDAFAQVLSLDMGNKDQNGTVTGRVVQMMALLTILSLAPSILMMMTSFTRIIVVLSFLRSAIGLQQTPPNSVMISLALFMTFLLWPQHFKSHMTWGLNH